MPSGARYGGHAWAGETPTAGNVVAPAADVGRGRAIALQIESQAPLTGVGDL